MMIWFPNLQVPLQITMQMDVDLLSSQIQLINFTELYPHLNPIQLDLLNFHLLVLLSALYQSWFLNMEIQTHLSTVEYGGVETWKVCCTPLYTNMVQTYYKVGILVSCPMIWVVNPNKIVELDYLLDVLYKNKSHSMLILIRITCLTKVKKKKKSKVV